MEYSLRKTQIYILGENLRIIRARYGWTQDEMGEKIQRSRRQISRYETGAAKKIDYDVVEKIAEVGRVSSYNLMNKLLEEEDFYVEDK